MLVFRILRATVYLVFALGMGTVMVEITHDMMRAAFTAHQKGPMSYNQFNQKLWQK